MTRLFIDNVLTTESEVTLTGEKARYLLRVLRYNAGDQLIVTDISSSSFNCKITSLSAKQVRLKVQGRLNTQTESPLTILLVQGLLKGDKMDYTIQKATELGVSSIVPAVTERSISRDTRKTDRWRRIAEEASRQCGRQKIPDIMEPRQFMDIINDRQMQQHGRLIFWEKNGVGCSPALNSLKGKSGIVLLIGPEGGFSNNEVSSATDRGFITATLGKRILRAETAAITAVALTQFVLGDMSENSPTGNNP